MKTSFTLLGLCLFMTLQSQGQTIANTLQVNNYSQMYVYISRFGDPTLKAQSSPRSQAAIQLEQVSSASSTANDQMLIIQISTNASTSEIGAGGSPPYGRNCTINIKTDNTLAITYGSGSTGGTGAGSTNSSGASGVSGGTSSSGNSSDGTANSGNTGSGYNSGYGTGAKPATTDSSGSTPSYSNPSSGASTTNTAKPKKLLIANGSGVNVRVADSTPDVVPLDLPSNSAPPKKTPPPANAVVATPPTPKKAGSSASLIIVGVLFVGVIVYVIWRIKFKPK